MCHWRVPVSHCQWVSVAQSEPWNWLLNRLWPLLMSLVPPVLCVLWHVRIFAQKKETRRSHRAKALAGASQFCLCTRKHSESSHLLQGLAVRVSVIRTIIIYFAEKWFFANCPTMRDWDFSVLDIVFFLTFSFHLAGWKSMSAYLTPNSTCKIRLEKIGAETSEIQHFWNMYSIMP